VQVGPIKPTLKAPGTEPMKQKWDELLSNFAFKFKLRLYNQGRRADARGAHGTAAQVDHIKLTLKAPGTKRLKRKYDRSLSTLLSNSPCAATTRCASTPHTRSATTGATTASRTEPGPSRCGHRWMTPSGAATSSWRRLTTYWSGLTLVHFSAQLKRILWERGAFSCCLGSV